MSQQAAYFDDDMTRRKHGEEAARFEASIGRGQLVIKYHAGKAACLTGSMVLGTAY